MLRIAQDRLASPTPILESEHRWQTRVLIFTQLFVRPFRSQNIFASKRCLPIPFCRLLEYRLVIPVQVLREPHPLSPAREASAVAYLMRAILLQRWSQPRSLFLCHGGYRVSPFEGGPEG